MRFCLNLSKRCRFSQINKTTPFATKSSAGAFLSAHALSGSIQVFFFPLKNHPNWGDIVPNVRACNGNLEFVL